MLAFEEVSGALRCVWGTLFDFSTFVFLDQASP